MGNLLGRIPSLFESPTLSFRARRLEEDQNGIVHQLKNLASALDVDLEDDVGPLRSLRDRRAIEVVEEFRPFEKTAFCDSIFERLAVTKT